MGIRVASLPGTLLVIACGIGPIQAAVRCVPLSHPGACDQRYATIQEAVDASASSGDSIFVAAGIYVEQVTVQGKSVSLFGARAGNDARGRVGSETVVAHPLGALVACGDGLVVDGFTFAGATDIAGNWAAVWIDGTPCVAGGGIIFRNNIVRDSIWGMLVNGAPVAIERSWFLANNAVPQYSLGLQLSATSDVRVERSRFESHAGPSLELSATTRISVLRNGFDGRVRLLATTDSTFEGNASASAAPGAVLFELAGGVNRTAFVGNTISVVSGRALWLSPDSASDPNSAITLHENCIRGPGAVGLEVAAGAHSGPLDATTNWWGAASGPSGTGPGAGSSIVDPGGAVAFTPFLATSSTCPCTELPDGSACDDGDPCTSADRCLSGTCRSGAAPSCDDANACTVNSCDPQSGACSHSSAHCSDGYPCTINSCNSSGQCVHSGDSCDDGNPCTSDDCDAAGGCTHVPVSGPCDDGDPCTRNDACDVHGNCQPGVPVCDDRIACTENVCDPQTLACTFPPRDCNDANLCTADTCAPATGECVHAPACDDGNPCNDDLCDPSTGACTHRNVDSHSCDDHNACVTGEHCVSGVCVPGLPLTCADANPCTNDGCDPATGCFHTFQPGPCDDANPCTANDACAPSGCTPGLPRLCDDGKACTDDSCDPAVGCVSVRDDTNLCMTAGACGTCFDGTCLPVAPNCDDGIDCTIDGCSSGGCYHAPDNSRCGPDPIPWDCTFPACTFAGCGTGEAPPNSPCDDPATCGAGRCFGGQCAVFVPCVFLECELCNRQTGQCLRDGSCNDGNPCTVNSCLPHGGCVNSSAHCADGNPCTTDFCGASGQCEHGVTSCDDGNPCTDDTCLPESGCVSSPDNTNTCTGPPGVCGAAFACNTGVCIGVQAAEVNGVRFSSGKSTLAWNLAPSGFGMRYQVLRGVLGDLPVGHVPATEACVAQTTSATATVSESPATGSPHWFLVRVNYTQCDGQYGFQGVNGAPGTPRVSATCP